MQQQANTQHYGFRVASTSSFADWQHAVEMCRAHMPLHASSGDERLHRLVDGHRLPLPHEE